MHFKILSNNFVRSQYRSRRMNLAMLRSVLKREREEEEE